MHRQTWMLSLLLLATAGFIMLSGCGKTTTQAPPAVETPVASTAVAVDGAALFAQNCAGCHGENGEKKRGWLEEVREESAEKLANTVRKGEGRMPAFGDQLSDAEIDAVIAHSKELAGK